MNGSGDLSQDVYEKLGRYVVLFQWLDGELAEILSRCVGGEHWFRGLEIFSEMSFKDKTRHAKAMFAALMTEREEAGHEHPFGDGWNTRFPALIKQCETINSQRNKLIHSSYLHIESNDTVMAVVRSKFRTGQLQRTLDQGNAVSEIEKAIEAITAIALEISQARIQLVHWS